LSILRAIGNVRDLEISGDFLSFSERKMSTLKLKNLEELTLNGAKANSNSSRVSKILNYVKPQKLALNVQEYWTRKGMHFESWLMKQDRLAELNVKGRAMSIFGKEFTADKLNIKLRKFIIEIGRLVELWMLNSRTENVRRNISFCRSQRNLEEVVLRLWFISDPIVVHLLDNKI
jgi:hypothetical protein